MKHNHSCMFNHELLTSYVTRNVTPGERITVEQHLNQCAKCRDEIKVLEETWLALDVWHEDVASAKPRLNDLRLRLKAHHRKPTFGELFRNKLDTIMAPFRWVPASPVLAVIVTGFFAYLGIQTNWGTSSTQNPVKPTFVSNPSPEAIHRVIAEVNKQENNAATSNLPASQTEMWNMLVDSTNPNPMQPAVPNFVIRMATNGPDFLQLTNFPSKDIGSSFNQLSPIRPSSAHMMNGTLVRLE